jgi:hypothetical protein
MRSHWLRIRGNRTTASLPPAPRPTRVTLRLNEPLAAYRPGTATEDRGMKHLLNGVAIAAALAIAAPVWAQSGAPMTPSSRAPAAASTAAPAPMATKARGKRVTHRRTARRGKARMATSDSMANQLNAQELSRAGGARNPMAPGTLGGGYGQPSPTQGIPGGDQPSASSHPPPSR